MARKFYTPFLACLALIAIPHLAGAATISVDPASQTASVGNNIDVGITISGLGSGGSPSLSTFDLDILFDPSHLFYLGADFGDPVLGDQLDLFGFGSLFSDSESGGILNLYELSFDLPDDLDLLQADSFTLATVHFNVLSAAKSAVDIAINSLGDSLGDPIAADTISGFVDSRAPSGTVPEPSVAWLLLAGGIVSRLQKRRRETTC